MNTRTFAVVLAGLISSGCSLGKDNIIFVTKTSLGVDVDSKPPTLDIGFDRKEGTIAPVLGEGQVLPVMGSFATDTGIISQALGQSFATGQASILMSQYLGSLAGPDVDAVIGDDAINTVAFIDDVDERKRYFFGTDTSFGFRVNFGLETGGYPDSVSLGYKRKEVAYVPLISAESNGEDVLALPSLIATAGLNTVTTTPGKTRLMYSQFFGTGAAANYLAAQPGIRAAMAARIVPEAEEQSEAVLLELKGRRDVQWLAEERQVRIEAILNDIDQLPDDAAFALSASPPVADDNAETILKRMDPKCLRLADRDCDGDGSADVRGAPDPDAARKTLKMRAVLGADRSDEALAAWEAAVKASE